MNILSEVWTEETLLTYLEYFTIELKLHFPQW